MPGARPVMVNTTGPSALAVRSRATYSALVLPSGSERVRNRKVPLSAVPAITGRTAMRPAARAVLSSRLRPARVLMESPLPVPPFRFRAAPRIYRLQSWDPKVTARPQVSRQTPQASASSGCAWPTSVGNALAAVGAHRAEGIGFGAKLRSLLRHRARPGWARSSQSAVTYTSTSTSAPWTRTAYRATPRGAGGPSASPVLML